MDSRCDGPWSGESLTRLAGRARWALTEGEDATLLVAGLGELGAIGAEVLLHDHGGQPVFVCPSTPEVLSGSGRTALLSVTADLGGPAPVRVVFTGQLSVLDEQSDPDAVILNLALTQVAVATADLTPGPVVQQVIPLELYWQTVPDPLAEHADSIVRHTNRHHESQLRDFAAAQSGVPSDHIAAAALKRLDLGGALLIWIDLDGAHELDVPFPRPADSPEALGYLLRERLEGHLEPYRTDDPGQI